MSKLLTVKYSPPTQRWVSEKKLSTINYLRMLPRITDTQGFRNVLLAHHKNNKKEFKDFIAEYRINGYYKAIENRRAAKARTLEEFKAAKLHTFNKYLDCKITGDKVKDQLQTRND